MSLWVVIASVIMIIAFASGFYQGLRGRSEKQKTVAKWTRENSFKAGGLFILIMFLLVYLSTLT